MLVSEPSKNADVFFAIADPSRRRMLDLLRDKECSVSELVPEFSMTIGAVSQHLKILRESGLVMRRTAGRQRLYRAEPSALKAVHDWTETFSAFWEARLDRLGAVLDEDE